MALLRIACKCGHEYDALSGNVIRDEDAERCPKCGSSDIHAKVPTRVNAHSDRIDTSTLDADTIASLQENRAWMEANADKLLSGEWGDKVGSRCPDEFRPQVPEHLKKRYY